MPDIWLDVDTAVTIPVNVMPLVDDTDFKAIEEAIAWNAAGMDLNWNFCTSAGVITQTNVVPTTGGDYDWTHVGNGMYKIEMTANGGASANNDTEGYGWFSGVCTGVLAWRGPTIGFRDSDINDLLCDNAYSATRGLAGTALPAAAANAAGGLPISAGGGLALDTQLANTHEVTAARMGALTDWIDGGRLDLLLDAIPTTVPDAAGTAAALHVTTDAAIAALNDFDPVNDAVANVTLVGTCTTNTDMRGTDGANTTVPDAAGVAAGLHATTDAAIAALNNLSSAQAQAACTAAIVAYNPPTGPEMTAAFTEIKGAGWLLADDTLKQISDGVDAIAAGGDATAANQTIIINHLTDIKGVGWVAPDDSLKDMSDAIDAFAAGGDATAANQATIIVHLTDIKGTGFVKDTHSLVNMAAATPTQIDVTFLESNGDVT